MERLLMTLKVALAVALLFGLCFLLLNFRQVLECIVDLVEEYTQRLRKKRR